MRKTLVAILSLASLFASTSALAGATRTDEVTIGTSPTYSYADGQVTSARFSADTRQYIKCQISSLASDADVFCQARNAAGTYLACSSDNWAHRVAVESINEMSEIYFNKYSGSTCATIRVTNDSRHVR